MTDENGKRLINKVLAIVIAGLLLNVIIGGFWTWKLSYKNSLVNEWQQTSIDENTKDIDAITSQFYVITSDLKTIKEKLR